MSPRLATAGAAAAATTRSLLRRRFAMAILVAWPLALYVVRHGQSWQAIRSLLFGVSWAVTSLAFFAASTARRVEPLLELRGAPRLPRFMGRLGAVLAMGLGLAGGYAVLVAIDLDVRSEFGILVALVVTAAVAVAVGGAIGSFPVPEMEGILVIFLVAALQAVVNPFDRYAKALPFWSSRQLGTWAIDGPDRADLTAGLVHAALVSAIAVVVTVVMVQTRSPRVRPLDDGDRLSRGPR